MTGLTYHLPLCAAPICTRILIRYEMMAPHHGPVYQEENRKVLNLAITLVKDSKVGNTNVQIFLAQSDGWGLVLAIATYYRGQGILNQYLIEAGAIIDKLIYLVEEPPHMICDQFKMNINHNYMLAANHIVQHNNHTNLHTLITKMIKSDFFKEVSSNIEVNMLVVEPYYFKNPIVHSRRKRRNKTGTTRVRSQGLVQVISRKSSAMVKDKGQV